MMLQHSFIYFYYAISIGLSLVVTGHQYMGRDNLQEKILNSRALSSSLLIQAKYENNVIFYRSKRASRRPTGQRAPKNLCIGRHQGCKRKSRSNSEGTDNFWSRFNDPLSLLWKSDHNIETESTTSYTNDVIASEISKDKGTIGRSREIVGRMRSMNRHQNYEFNSNDIKDANTSEINTFRKVDGIKSHNLMFEEISKNSTLLKQKLNNITRNIKEPADEKKYSFITTSERTSNSIIVSKEDIEISAENEDEINNDERPIKLPDQNLLTSEPNKKLLDTEDYNKEILFDIGENKLQMARNNSESLKTIKPPSTIMQTPGKINILQKPDKRKKIQMVLRPMNIESANDYEENLDVTNTPRIVPKISSFGRRRKGNLYQDKKIDTKDFYEFLKKSKPMELPNKENTRTLQPYQINPTTEKDDASTFYSIENNSSILTGHSDGRNEYQGEENSDNFNSLSFLETQMLINDSRTNDSGGIKTDRKKVETGNLNKKSNFLNFLSSKMNVTLESNEENNNINGKDIGRSRNPISSKNPNFVNSLSKEMEMKIDIDLYDVVNNISNEQNYTDGKHKNIIIHQLEGDGIQFDKTSINASQEIDEGEKHSGGRKFFPEGEEYSNDFFSFLKTQMLSNDSRTNGKDIGRSRNLISSKNPNFIQFLSKEMEKKVEIDLYDVGNKFSHEQNNMDGKHRNNIIHQLEEDGITFEKANFNASQEISKGGRKRLYFDKNKKNENDTHSDIIEEDKILNNIVTEVSSQKVFSSMPDIHMSDTDLRITTSNPDTQVKSYYLNKTEKEPVSQTSFSSTTDNPSLIIEELNTGTTNTGIFIKDDQTTIKEIRYTIQQDKGTSDNESWNKFDDVEYGTNNPVSIQLSSISEYSSFHTVSILNNISREESTTQISYDYTLDEQTTEDLTGISHCSEKCNEEYEPVCGSNNVTYENKCKLQMESCKNKDIKYARNGLCASVKFEERFDMQFDDDNPQPSYIDKHPLPMSNGPEIVGIVFAAVGVAIFFIGIFVISKESCKS